MTGGFDTADDAEESRLADASESASPIDGSVTFRPTAPRPVLELPPRRPWLGGLLLILFVPLSFLSVVAAFRLRHLVSVAASQDDRESQMSDREYEAEVMRQSNRNVLFFGSTEQRLDLIHHLGNQGIAASAYLDDLRKIMHEGDVRLAPAALVAIRRIEADIARYRLIPQR